MKASIAIAMLMGFAIVGCDNQTFSNGTPRKTDLGSGELDGVKSIYIAGTESQTKETPENVDSLINGLRFDPGNLKNTPGEVEKLPLDIYFVLDVTASMGAVLNSIKNNIQTFSANLSQEFRPKFGAIAFRDGIVGSFSLSDNVASFQSFIASQRASGGNDQNESALLGLHHALNAIATQSRPEATKAILIITDNPGHSSDAVVIPPKGKEYEPSTARDCSLSNLTRSIQNLPTLSRSLLQIYHSTGSTYNNLQQPCSGFSTATQQMDTLLNQALRVGNSNPNVGERLSFPFNSATLVTEFSEKLKTNRPAVEVACIAESAQLSLNDAPVNTWKAKSLQDSYQRFKAGKTLDWKNPVPQSLTAELNNKKVTLKIRRCCLEASKAAAGNFSTCDYKLQTAEFTVYQPETTATLE